MAKIHKIPFKEDMQCKPQDPYGIAKYASELLIKNAYIFITVLTQKDNSFNPKSKLSLFKIINNTIEIIIFKIMNK